MLFADCKFLKIFFQMFHLSPDKVTFQPFNILTQFQRAEGSSYMLKEWEYLSNGYGVTLTASSLD